ncbi:MAG TPA: ATP-binding protein [Novosphingobium sp.]|nr:ATP-binding protein [Novosphingobium sp.]
MSLSTLADPRRWSLTARLAVVVVLILLLDFGSNAYLFQRAGQFTLADAEADGLAEQLAHAAAAVEAAPPAARPDVARRLASPALALQWQAGGQAGGQDARAPGAGIVLAGLTRQLVRENGALARLRLQVQLAPLRPRDGFAGTMQLGDGSMLAFRIHTHSTWPLLLGHVINLLLPTAAFLPLAAGLVFAALRPLRQLARASGQVGTRHASALAETGPAELRALIGAFNAMQQRIDGLLDANAQTMLAIGHDLRTPLARLQLRIDTLRLPADDRAALEADVDEMRDLLGSLQAYVEGDGAGQRREPVDLAAMAQTLVDQATEQGAEASYAGPPRVVVDAHATALRRALANLLGNALQYGGRARVRLRQQGSMIEIAIEDDGPGIAEAHLAKVLQPFVRLDHARERNTRGMGLGLAIVDKAVRAQGGTLVLENRPAGGLVARICLPARG